jgi:hypothetical protein
VSETIRVYLKVSETASGDESAMLSLGFHKRRQSIAGHASPLNGWRRDILKFAEGWDGSIDAALTSLEEDFWQVLKEIVTASECKVELQVVQEIVSNDANSKGLSLSADLIKLLASVKAALDIDQYVLD